MPSGHGHFVRVYPVVTILYPPTVLQPVKMSYSIEDDDDVLVKTVSKAGICEFVEYVPVDRNYTNAITVYLCISLVTRTKRTRLLLKAR